jgi:hypothetical protein
LEENKETIFEEMVLGYIRFNARHFSYGIFKHELADFGTKKSIGWIAMLYVR